MLCVISYQRPSNSIGGDTLKKKKKGCSTQELIGIKTFTKYGLKVGKQEMLFFLVQPTNISVLSPENIEIKVHHLQMVLSALPDIEIVCTDSCECFDDNRYYIKDRIGFHRQHPHRNLNRKTVSVYLALQIHKARTADDPCQPHRKDHSRSGF